MVGLQNLLVDATVGFGLGFAIGVNDRIDESEQRIELDVYARAGKEEVSPRDSQRLASSKQIANISKVAPSMCSAMLYSTVANINYGGEFSSSLITSAAAVLGRFTGAGVRYLANKDQRRETTRLIGALRSENGIESFVTEDQKIKFKELLGKLEEECTNTGEFSVDNSVPLKGIYDLFSTYRQPSLQFVLGWTGPMVAAAIRKGKIGYDVKTFFEERLPDKMAIGAIVMGDVQSPHVRTYSKEGSMFNVGTADWEDSRITKKDGSCAELFVKAPRLNTLSMLDSTPDYRAIAGEIDSSKDTTILLNSGVEIPELRKGIILTRTFMPLYGSYLLNKTKGDASEDKR